MSNTLVGWLTVSSTLWHRSLSATSSDSNSEDDETLLGLVTQSSGLVWSRWSRSSVDDVLLSVLPTSDSQQESGDIRLLLSLQLFQVFVGTHCICVTDKEKKYGFFSALFFFQDGPWSAHRVVCTLWTVCTPTILRAGALFAAFAHVPSTETGPAGPGIRKCGSILVCGGSL